MTRGVYLAQVLWPMPSRTVEARQRLRVTCRSPIRTSNDVDGGSIGPLATIHDYRTMRTKQLDGATTTGSMRTDDYPSIGEGRRVARTASPAKTPDRSVGAVEDDHRSAAAVAGRLTAQLTRKDTNTHPLRLCQLCAKVRRS